MNNPLQSVRNWFTVPRAGDVAALQAQVARLEAAVEAAEVRGEGGDSASIPQGELGFTGLKIVNGVIDDEYLTALDDLEDRVERQMRHEAPPGAPFACRSWCTLPRDPVGRKTQRWSLRSACRRTWRYALLTTCATRGNLLGSLSRMFEEQEGLGLA